MSSRRFFNEEIETLPKEKLKALQLQRLQATVERVYHQNTFYRKLYDEAGVKPSDIRSLEDIQKLPFLEKKTVRAAYPYGVAMKQPGGEDGAVELHATSGTTGKSVPVFATMKDIEHWAELNARELWMTGLRPGDVLMNCYGYGLPTGGFGFHYGAMKMGVMAIPMGADARQYERLIDFIYDFGVAGMCMTPSVGLYVGNKAREMGIDFTDTKLKVGIFGAEPWPWETRLKLEEYFNIKAYDEFGMTEFLGPGMTCECEARDGMHAWADTFLVECINPETGEPVPEGEEGELVWTWLESDGTAMIRYRSRDLSRLWWEECCTCGRTHPKIGSIKGRTDDAVLIRGLVVFPSQVEAALLRFPETGVNFRIVVDRKNDLDTFDLLVEVKEPTMLASEDLTRRLQKEMAAAVKSVTGNTPHVHLVGPDTLPRATGGESKTASARVEDRRK
ncbi:phenylacetate-CoA ligase [Thermosporothrix hazakensis]|jgi:phenylacetate-CoA ligase|uniref:Phenylacetate-coenzyme A ligase n=2 Tax=Thermosporothrix TaxID=768650 RepID=A0A326UDE6_THEHA|nr:phenylacetate--CoA ligase [Thermosporothrix hazakensis]PZW36064.1 phenylacetate-CoA ligase [Thermosporothrix hazakensis]BBH88530.1 phenylacetate-coenzyme A ligase [Thermosporothrix sp. COM3]GCE46715.1 phenylacetate-coenzyme A ligase [Thermosporothrix hazakensis]